MKGLHNTHIVKLPTHRAGLAGALPVIASKAKQSITPCNHDRLPRHPAPRNDQKNSCAIVSNI